VPFTSFSEYETTAEGKKVPVWFAPDENRPLMTFAGIWTNWSSLRKTKEGEVNADLYAFLTTEPNAVVAPIHPKAMPVVLTIPRKWTSGCVRSGRRPRSCSVRCRTAHCRSLRAVSGRTLKRREKARLPSVEMPHKLDIEGLRNGSEDPTCTLFGLHCAEAPSSRLVS